MTSPRYVPRNVYDPAAGRWHIAPFDRLAGVVNGIYIEDQDVIAWWRVRPAMSVRVPIVLLGTALAFLALAIAWGLA